MRNDSHRANESADPGSLQLMSKMLSYLNPITALDEFDGTAVSPLKRTSSSQGQPSIPVFRYRCDPPLLAGIVEILAFCL